MPSNVLVSGAGSSEVNGLYTFAGEANGKPYYNLVGYESTVNDYSISWDGGSFILIVGEPLYNAFEQNVAYPWLGIWTTSNGLEPAPTVTEIPAQPTFGLPADVVALIESRFGSVARFLRLRNLGQV